jgi:hypothetical protein
VQTQSVWTVCTPDERIRERITWAQHHAGRPEKRDTLEKGVFIKTDRNVFEFDIRKAAVQNIRTDRTSRRPSERSRNPAAMARRSDVRAFSATYRGQPRTKVRERCEALHRKSNFRCQDARIQLVRWDWLSQVLRKRRKSARCRWLSSLAWI